MKESGNDPDKWMKDRIMSVLNEGNDIKKYPLLRRIDVPATQERKLRKLIADLVSEGEKIGSTTIRGYYIVESDDDLEQAVDKLRDQVKTLAVRANTLVKNCKGKEDPQINLEFNDLLI